MTRPDQNDPVPPSSIDDALDHGLDQALTQWVERDRQRFDSTGAMQALRRRRADAQRLERTSDARSSAGGARAHAKYLWTFAAACAAAIVAGLAVRYQHGKPPRASTLDAPHVYTTTTGQRATLTLADGSRVTLAPQSVLRVGAGFGIEHRTVSLTGEAWFDVPQVQRIPLIVQTNLVRTRVLGTTFDVRWYASDMSTRVAVMSGRVSSGTTRASVTLAAGMVAVIDDSIAHVVHDDAQAATTWTKGRLVFNNTPASEVLREVGRWCGYEFRIADSTIADERVTTALVVTEPAETMAVLEDLLDVSMTFDGKVVTLRHRKRAASAPSGSRRDPRTTFPLHSEIGK